MESSRKTLIGNIRQEVDNDLRRLISSNHKAYMQDYSGKNNSVVCPPIARLIASTKKLRGRSLCNCMLEIAVRALLACYEIRIAQTLQELKHEKLAPECDSESDTDETEEYIDDDEM